MTPLCFSVNPNQARGCLCLHCAHNGSARLEGGSEGEIHTKCSVVLRSLFNSNWWVGGGGVSLPTHNSYVCESAVDGGNTCPAETGFIGCVI